MHSWFPSFKLLGCEGLFTRVRVIWRVGMYKQMEQNPGEGGFGGDGQLVVLVRFPEDGIVHGDSWK